MKLTGVSSRYKLFKPSETDLFLQTKEIFLWHYNRIYTFLRSGHCLAVGHTATYKL